MVRFFCIAVVFFVTIHDALATTKAQLIDSIFSTLYRKGRFNGNVLIAEKGRVLYQKSFGIANEATGEKLNTNSIFELASVSKPFTAMAIVLLKEQSKLSYDDSLARYFPQLPQYKNVTIRQLLHHNGGLPDYMKIADTAWDKSKILTNRSLLDLLVQSNVPLLFEPDTRNEYSNTGYALLALIIEKVSGQSYADFLKKHIFIPLKMQHTFVYTRRYHPLPVKNYAYGYVYSDSLKKQVLPDSLAEYNRVYYDDGVVGQSTVNTTTGDLLKWDRALYTNTLVSARSIQDIFTSGKLKNGKEVGYGFGWMLDLDTLFGHVAAHTGGWPGYVTFIERHLDSDKTIIILQNHYTDAEIPYEAIRAILYNHPLPKEKSEIDLPVKDLSRFEGKYQLPSGTIIKVYLQGQTLNVQPGGQNPFAIYAESPNSFFVKDANAQVSFEEDDQHAVQKMTIHQNGRNIEVPKVR